MLLKYAMFINMILLNFTPSLMETTFGKRVKEFRQFKNLSQQAFAEACGLTQGNIAHMENGTEPKQSNVSKLAAGFPDLNPDWLLLGTGPMLRDGRTLTPAPATPTETEKPTEGEALLMVPSLPTVDTKRLSPVAEGHLFISHSLERMLSSMTPEQQAAFWRGMFEEEVQRNKATESDLLDRLTRKMFASSGAAAPQPFIESDVPAPAPRLIGPRFDEPIVLDFYTGQRKAA